MSNNNSVVKHAACHKHIAKVLGVSTKTVQNIEKMALAEIREKYPHLAEYLKD